VLTLDDTVTEATRLLFATDDAAPTFDAETLLSLDSRSTLLDLGGRIGVAMIDETGTVRFALED
jgi:hypothetical protein